MKVNYGSQTDTLTIIFAKTPVTESDEDKPGVILDYDDKGNLVSLEILDASRRVSVQSRIEFQVSPVAGYFETNSGRFAGSEFCFDERLGRISTR
ncbi:MAG: DUF2283 domain-containing protein [Chloroflexi bacterium]|nr:DUF2283 domain-containing protein [Chloroflexota bacterium]